MWRLEPQVESQLLGATQDLNPALSIGILNLKDVDHITLIGTVKFDFDLEKPVRTLYVT